MRTSQMRHGKNTHTLTHTESERFRERETERDRERQRDGETHHRKKGPGNKKSIEFSVN